MNRAASILAAASLSTFAALGGLAGCSDAASTADRSCASGNQALSVCAGASTVKGVDVSTYQGAVNWTAVKNAGIDFAFARISDGTANPDDQFVANWKGMKSAGVVRGAYQFFRPSVDPMAQVNLVMSKLAAAGGFQSTDLPIVMDIEVTDNLSPSQIQAAMKPWLTAIEQKTGKKPIIYTAAFMSANIGNGFDAYPLWVANYGATCPTMPSNFTAWKFWQNADNGAVGGISGGVDTDLWNGTLAQLKSYAGETNNPPPADAGTGSHDAGTTHDGGSAHDAGSDGGAPEPPPAAGDAGATMGSGSGGSSSSGSNPANGETNPCP